MKKKIPKGSCRIIKIGQDAMFEWIYENIIDKMETQFDVLRSDVTKLTLSFDIDWETREFICIAHNHGFNNIYDTECLLSKLKDTTNTLYGGNRYIELTDAEVLAIQNGKENEYTR